MFYSLNEDVYLVEGISNDAIYNLVDGNLYQINKNDSNRIKSIIAKDITYSFSPDQKQIIKQLSDKNIIWITEGKNIQCIKNFKINPKYNFAWIEVCNNCNLKCKHCYNNSSALRNSFMSLEDFKKVCFELHQLDIKKNQIIGGEPFCNPQIMQMLEYASSVFSFIEIFTNGTLITEDICSFIKDKEIKIAVSIYSYIPNEHDKITMVSGSFNKTYKLLNNLKTLGIKYRVATVHMKDHCLGNRNGEPFVLNPVKDVIRLSGRANVSLLTPELLKRKLITRESFKNKLNKTKVIENVNFHQCFGKKLYISSTLEVYPCVMERRISHGNMKMHNLSTILNPEIQCLNKDFIDECKCCELRYACFDCRPDSLDNNLLSKPYYCTYDVKNGKWQNVEEFVNNFFSKTL